jgi:hypothetical protein
LLGGQKVGQGIDDILLDGSLEVPGAVLDVCALLQQEAARRGRDAE